MRKTNHFISLQQFNKSKNKAIKQLRWIIFKHKYLRVINSVFKSRILPIQSVRDQV